MIVNHLGAPGGASTPGADGITPHIGANTHWFIGEEDTGVCASAVRNADIVPITLLSSDWDSSNKTQSVAVPGVISDELAQAITITPDDEAFGIYKSCGISCYEQSAGILRFVADSIPAEDIQLYVMMETVGEDTSAYSLEEQVVGRWIDGKPIYRSVLLGTLGNCTTGGTSVYSYIDASTLDIDNVCDIRGVFYTSSESERFVPIPHAQGDTSNSRSISISYAALDGQIQLRHNAAGWSSLPVTIYFEYTKTTDEATVDMTALADSYDEGVQNA